MTIPWKDPFCDKFTSVSIVQTSLYYQVKKPKTIWGIQPVLVWESR